ncbi:glycosyltransferase WbpZ [Devosia nitrariae]|uniref:Glycosyltransferase WbpZ n=1 Tax=Devosia nitrariae TaxID=2071872 RepID=A0ABQ5W4K1_9HYPH|nr:glycosyltransferase WbpZ [Devosia nitrariae]
MHVYKTYLPEDFTGIPRVIHAIAEGLAGSGIETEVLALYGNDVGSAPFKVGNHLVHPIRRDMQIASASLSLRAFPEFGRLVRHADVVHYHFPWPMADLLHLAYGRRTPSVVTYHSDIVRQQRLLRFYAPVMNAFLAKVDAIVATSPNYHETSPVLARHRKKVSVIPIGIGEREPVGEPHREAWRSRVGEGFFLFVGALRYYKGAGFLIEAARITGLPVVIAGSNDRKELDVAGLPANVTYVGEVSEADKEALLDLCSAFAFPSHLRSEAFGVALLEAARAGRPMISCEIGTGTSYVNVDGQTGLVVEPASPHALARAMTTLSGNDEMVARMGANARHRYKQLFRSADAAQAYLNVYRDLAAGRPR